MFSTDPPATDPGDYHGYLRDITPFVRHVILDFDIPLTGFDMTFVIQRFFSTPDAPDTIYAYDGPGGTGNLIATVTTVDAPATNFRAQIDFVGVYVDGPPTIRSALIAGGPLDASYSELRITGIAVATPVPEPAASWMFIAGAATLGASLRRRRLLRGRGIHRETMGV